MTAWGILAAAGEGLRLGAGPKSFVELAGIPMIVHSLVSLAKTSAVDGIVMVVPVGLAERGRAIASSAVPAAHVEVVEGGETRQQSVRTGLSAVPQGVPHVVVHDAARPLAAVALFETVLAALSRAAGAVVAIPERDTIKRESAGRVVETVARSNLWRAQTPQAFRTDVLRMAHDRAAAEGLAATDDAMLLEWIGEAVEIVEGDARNLKITTPAELLLAEAILASRQAGD